MRELALSASATPLWVGAFGIGITACAVAPHLLREHTLPTAMGIRLFGGEPCASGSFRA